MLEYYQPAFALIHQELARYGYSIEEPHSLRSSFWRLIEPGDYDPWRGRELVSSYLARVETELRQIIGRHSVAYWLHAYRRIAPLDAGSNKSDATRLLVRATMESAVHKYGLYKKCSAIASSTEVSPERVFRAF
jgi:hypothetical protein